MPRRLAGMKPGPTFRRGFLATVLLLTFVGLLAACVASPGGSGGPGPSGTPGSSPGPILNVARLKLAVIDRFGSLWYCDPDFYPLQRGEEIDHARERLPEMRADADAFAAITTAKGIDPAGPFTDAQLLAVYQAWKILTAIALDPIGNDTYRFDYLAQPAGGAGEGTRTGGTITSAGSITIEQQAAAGEPICPICLSRGSRVDGPDGPFRVEDLRVGDVIWTVDANARRVPGTVIAVGFTVAPAGHRVIHLILADGRSVTASPGHPLADGRLIGDLDVGDLVDGSAVAVASIVAYQGGETFDLVVGGATGTYFVDGVPLGSTLRP